MSKHDNPIIEGFLDGIISRVMKKVQAKDPKMKRLKKQSAELEKSIRDMLIDRFGSLDKVPDSYKKFYLKI
jgi:hypothetical protein